MASLVQTTSMPPLLMLAYICTYTLSYIDVCAYVVHGEYMLKTVLSASYQLIMSKHV